MRNQKNKYIPALTQDKPNVLEMGKMVIIRYKFEQYIIFYSMLTKGGINRYTADQFCPLKLSAMNGTHCLVPRGSLFLFLQCCFLPNWK